MALYSIYRPQNFQNMVGQDALKNTLLNASLYKRLSHAYLFCGTRGTGKTTSARILAKAINCTNTTETGDPCGRCEMCTLAEQGKLTDIIEIDAASNRGIDEIRDLREKVSFAPNTASSKIYIIDEVHMLTKEAFNALLKTLEEPPSHAYFILATTEYHKVPETIRSRCQTFFFKNISIQNIVDRLEFICNQENFEYTKDGLKMIASRSNGGLRDAISLLEQSANFGKISPEVLRKNLGIIDDKILESFFLSLQNSNSENAFSVLHNILGEGRSLEEFGKDFLGYLKQVFHRFISEKNALLPWVIESIEIFQESLDRSKRFEIPSLAFEMGIAKVLLLNKEFKDQLISKNEELIIKKDKNIHEEQDKSKGVGPASNDGMNGSDLADISISQSEENKTIEVKKISPKKSLEKKEPEVFTSDDDLMPPWEEEQSPIKKDETVPVEVRNFEPQKPEKEELKPLKQDIPSQSDDQKTQTSKPKIDDLFTHIVAEWKNLCGKLPGGIRLNLLEHGTPYEFHENTLFLSLSSPAVKSLIGKPETLEKIASLFSKELGTDIQVALSQVEETKDEQLSVDQVESLLRF